MSFYGDSGSRSRGVYDAFNSLRSDQVVEVNVKNELTATIRTLIGMNEDVTRRLRIAEERANAIERDLNQIAASASSTRITSLEQPRNLTVTAIDPAYFATVKAELEAKAIAAREAAVAKNNVQAPQSGNTNADLDAFLALFNMSASDIRHHAQGTTRTKLEYLYDLPAWSGLIQWAHQPVGEGTFEMVDQVVEVPIRIPVKTVEKIIERPTPVVVEKVVEKPPQVVMMERVVEKPVITERIVEQPAVRMAPTVERVPQVVMTERVVHRQVPVMEQVVERVAGVDASHLSTAGPYVQTQGYLGQDVSGYSGYGSPSRLSPTRARLV